MGAKPSIQAGAKEAPLAGALGSFIRKSRQDVSMSLRDVELATNNEVSNSYLSQLESGKITKPSPHILFSLAEALRVNYELLMQRAGYILPSAPKMDARKRRPGASFSIDSLTAEEEAQLLEYLSFLRAKKK
jgi:transcriptional regulator with XRE-family HTH domain